MSEHLAREADRLKNDPVFIKALADIRMDALNALAGADAEDKIAILRLQQRVSVIDEISAMLERFILSVPLAQDEASPYA